MKIKLQRLYSQRYYESIIGNNPDDGFLMSPEVQEIEAKFGTRTADGLNKKQLTVYNSQSTNWAIEEHLFAKLQVDIGTDTGVELTETTTKLGTLSINAKIGGLDNTTFLTAVITVFISDTGVITTDSSVDLVNYGIMVNVVQNPADGSESSVSVTVVNNYSIFSGRADDIGSVRPAYVIYDLRNNFIRPEWSNEILTSNVIIDDTGNPPVTPSDVKYLGSPNKLLFAARVKSN